MGIEPTQDAYTPHTGFEDQGHHQAPVTSIIVCCYKVSELLTSLYNIIAGVPAKAMAIHAASSISWGVRPIVAAFLRWVSRHGLQRETTDNAMLMICLVGASSSFGLFALARKALKLSAVALVEDVVLACSDWPVQQVVSESQQPVWAGNVAVAGGAEQQGVGCSFGLGSEQQGV